MQKKKLRRKTGRRRFARVDFVTDNIWLDAKIARTRITWACISMQLFWRRLCLVRRRKNTASTVCYLIELSICERARTTLWPTQKNDREKKQGMKTRRVCLWHTHTHTGKYPQVWLHTRFSPFSPGDRFWDALKTTREKRESILLTWKGSESECGLKPPTVERRKKATLTIRQVHHQACHLGGLFREGSKKSLFHLGRNSGGQRIPSSLD